MELETFPVDIPHVSEACPLSFPSKLPLPLTTFRLNVYILKIFLTFYFSFMKNYDVLFHFYEYSYWYYFLQICYKGKETYLQRNINFLSIFPRLLHICWMNDKNVILYNCKVHSGYVHTWFMYYFMHISSLLFILVLAYRMHNGRN